MGRLQLKDMLTELDKREVEDRAGYAELLPEMGGDPLAKSEKYAMIRHILNSRPTLVAPCLEWLNTKLAQLAHAELSTLYTPEQIEAMKAEMASRVQRPRDGTGKV